MPKIRTFDFEVQGSPEEAAARIRRHITSGVEVPALQGESRPDGFEISFVPRPFSGELHAVVKGNFQAVGAGRTRVVGRCGPPYFPIWYFRLALLFVFPLLGWMGWTLIGEMAFIALPVAVWLSIMAIIPILGIGFNVWTANSEVDPLLDVVFRAYGLTTEAHTVGRRETDR